MALAIIVTAFFSLCVKVDLFDRVKPIKCSVGVLIHSVIASHAPDEIDLMSFPVIVEYLSGYWDLLHVVC